ncbi:uncharacterized protein BT62DRAFT_938253 [Guyanagaster necrorhizus]|uniref:Uncharacterized protein n=1 Tax=Guyanagaster necrorhizus TaxID=856835 RepID=A0A9P7VHT6_9AGAR|nr:uncharacterized protein BT62DRAFT_938253 [Guyanagaster necrorhizus MCA 3950]KAG7440189.1 hypothetical protein BT62DRAFT_938253 [Guyanagaster necrorhizus MCA 3950]
MTFFHMHATTKNDITVSPRSHTLLLGQANMHPLQCQGNGPSPARSLSYHPLSPTLCADLGIQGLLKKLNTTLSTLHDLRTKGVHSVLED